MLEASSVGHGPIPSPSGSLGETENNFVRVAQALNQHSKAIVGLREAFDQLSRAVNALYERVEKTNFSGPDGPLAAERLFQGTVLLRDQLAKLDANSASNFDLLSKSLTAASERLSNLETEVAEMQPTIEAMKIHSNSFPNALRAARRSDAEVQAAVNTLNERLQKLESRSRKPKKQS